MQKRMIPCEKSSGLAPVSNSALLWSLLWEDQSVSESIDLNRKKGRETDHTETKIHKCKTSVILQNGLQMRPLFSAPIVNLSSLHFTDSLLEHDYREQKLS